MKDTIKLSDEISYLFKEGRRLNTPNYTLIVLRNEKQHDQNGRVAFVAGKKLGNAVWRNRAKRRMRALCHSVGGPFPGYDIIFLAKRSVEDAPFETMRKQCLSALEHGNVLNNR